MNVSKETYNDFVNKVYYMCNVYYMSGDKGIDKEFVDYINSLDDDEYDEFFWIAKSHNWWTPNMEKVRI